MLLSVFSAYIGSSDEMAVDGEAGGTNPECVGRGTNVEDGKRDGERQDGGMDWVAEDSTTGDAIVSAEGLPLTLLLRPFPLSCVTHNCIFVQSVLWLLSQRASSKRMSLTCL